MVLRKGSRLFMNKGTIVLSLFLALALTLLAGCGGSSAPPTPDPLSADNLNLIFVVSEALAYQAPGDVNRVFGKDHRVVVGKGDRLAAELLCGLGDHFRRGGVGKLVEL